jgi:hypothetical protein
VAVPVLPVVPGASCPAAAAALAAAGLGPACQVVSGVTHAVSSATSDLAGFGADSVLNALGGWVSDGAAWLLGQIGTVIASTTGVDLGAGWFTAHYGTMMALAGVVIVPMLLLGIIQSIYRQNGSMLVRSVVVNVPLAILLTAVAVQLVQLGLAVTDAMSADVSGGANSDVGHFLNSVAVGLTVTSAATGQSSAPGFVLFLGGLAVVFGALLVWIELLIRAAAVYVTVLFLPLALASLAWPAIAHWCRRLVDTLVALILGKFVMVAVLSLAAGALAGGAGGGAGDGGFDAVLGGAAMLLLAAFAPWALFRLLPFLEAGAVGHLEGLSHRARQHAAVPVKGLAVVAMRASVAGSAIGAGRSIAVDSIGSAVNSNGPVGGLGASAAGLGGPGGAGDGPGGAGPPGTRPAPEPSSAQTTGVGTMDPPGHGIPGWAIHPEATAAGRRILEGDDSSSPTAASADNSDPFLVALPTATGTRQPHFLSRDELGVRLIAAPALPEAPRPADAPDRPR